MRYSLIRWCALLLSCCGLSAWAADAPVAGEDYQLLSPAQPTSNPGKIVVTEFFSYQCPHCFALFPSISSWSKRLPGDVVFERIPVGFGRSNWSAIAQGFYALQVMGKAEQLDRSVFNAIHTQNVMLKDEATITAWVAKQGVNAADFTAAYDSFGVRSSMSRSDQLAKNYQVQGVPDLIVDGKYRVINPGNLDQWLVRVDQVIAKVRAEKTHK